MTAAPHHAEFEQLWNDKLKTMFETGQGYVRGAKKTAFAAFCAGLESGAAPIREWQACADRLKGLP